MVSDPLGASSPVPADAVGTGGRPCAQLGEGSLAAERLLEELQEYHESAQRERAEFRHERAELTARLRRLECELEAEERVGFDLTQRIGTLEVAIQRERKHYDTLLRNANNGTAGEMNSLTEMPLPQLGHSEVPESQLLTVLFERLPREREMGCRELLHARLRELGIPDQVWPGAHMSDQPWSAAGLGPSDEGQRPAYSISKALADLDGDHSAASKSASIKVLEKHCTNGTQALEGTAVTMWKRQWTLRAHMDGARCVICDDQAGVLISCGEDALVKGWDLAPLWRGAPEADDSEPYITFRGHTSAVLSLAYRQQDRMLFSAGLDCSIRAWRLPESRSYHPFGASLAVRQCSASVFSGHRDSVWCLRQHPHLSYLMSASADGRIGLWSVDTDYSGSETGSMDASFTLPWPAEAEGSTGANHDIPACGSWVPTDATWVLGGYVSSRVAVFDVKRGVPVFDFLASEPAQQSQGSCASVLSTCCHQTMQLAATGHADKCARLLDLSSGRFVASLSEHGDAVTSLCIDPSKGHCLVTGCHDGFVRIFDLRTNRCSQSLRLHQGKYDEAMHCVHHSLRVLATAGADGHVVVMLPDD